MKQTSTVPAARPILGVLGGSGGAGATSLVAALAAGAGSAVIVDLDALGGGIDVVLGAEEHPGARWSGLHATGDRLDPAQLLEGLPRWGDVPVLACDSSAVPDADACRSVLGAAREIGPTVVDLGRCSTPARDVALSLCDAIVLVATAEICGATAAAAIQTRLVEDGCAAPLTLVVRRAHPVVSARRIADVLGLQLTGTLDEDAGLRGGRDRGIDSRRLSRGTRILARQLLCWAEGLASADAAVGGGSGNDAADGHAVGGASAGRGPSSGSGWMSSGRAFAGSGASAAGR